MARALEHAEDVRGLRVPGGFRDCGSSDWVGRGLFQDGKGRLDVWPRPPLPTRCSLCALGRRTRLSERWPFTQVKVPESQLPLQLGLTT